MKHKSTRIILLVLIEILILAPVQSLFACANMFTHQHESTAHSTNSYSFVNLKAQQHHDPADSHCIAKSHCQGDQCGHLVMLQNAATDTTLRLDRYFAPTQFPAHAQLVLARNLRPPISSLPR